jgi:hypothetical protein
MVDDPPQQNQQVIDKINNLAQEIFELAGELKNEIRNLKKINLNSLKCWIFFKKI